MNQEIDFYDLTPIMPQVNIERLLERMNIPIVSRTRSKKGNEIISYCPVHHMTKGKEQDIPKWYFNTDTGECHCWSCGDGSNIVYIVSRLRRCSHKKALEWILERDIGDDMGSIQLQMTKKRIKQIIEKTQKDSVTKLDKIESDFKKGNIYQDGLNFFMYPPNKKPTLILEDTVRRYKVIQSIEGYYKDRVIIPFYQKKKFVGYAAIDILGKDEWLRKRPGKSENEYRKVLYASKSDGFFKDETLFGFDDVPKNASFVLLTEGAREVMKCWQNGFNALAVLGSSISDKQISLLGELAPKKVIIMMDGDSAGVMATEKIMKKIKKFFPVSAIYLEDGFDPKVLNRDKMQQYINDIRKF